MAPHSVAAANLVGLVSMAKMREAPAFLAACSCSHKCGGCGEAIEQGRSVKISVDADCGGDAGAGARRWFTGADIESGTVARPWNRDIRGGGSRVLSGWSGRGWSGRGGVGPGGLDQGGRAGGGSHLDDSQADGAPAEVEGKAASWQQWKRPRGHAL